jgi:ABC-type phosphate transport system substrate-binding protein
MMMAIKNIILILSLMLSLQWAQAQPNNIVFIVNSQNPSETITVTELRDYYFKRKRRWGNGESVRFMDRTTGSLRDEFLKKYIEKSNSDVELYWIGQKLYSGDSAPIKEGSDATTMNFVGSLKGAISYVSESVVLKKNVKIIKVDMTGD